MPPPPNNPVSDQPTPSIDPLLPWANIVEPFSQYFDGRYDEPAPAHSEDNSSRMPNAWSSSSQATTAQTRQHHAPVEGTASLVWIEGPSTSESASVASSEGGRKTRKGTKRALPVDVDEEYSVQDHATPSQTRRSDMPPPTNLPSQVQQDSSSNHAAFDPTFRVEYSTPAGPSASTLGLPPPTSSTPSLPQGKSAATKKRKHSPAADNGSRTTQAKTRRTASKAEQPSALFTRTPLPHPSHRIKGTNPDRNTLLPPTAPNHENLDNAGRIAIHVYTKEQFWRIIRDFEGTGGLPGILGTFKDTREHCLLSSTLLPGYLSTWQVAQLGRRMTSIFPPIARGNGPHSWPPHDEQTSQQVGESAVSSNATNESHHSVTPNGFNPMYNTMAPQYQSVNGTAQNNSSADALEQSFQAQAHYQNPAPYVAPPNQTNDGWMNEGPSAYDPSSTAAFNGPPGAPMPLPEANFQSMNQYDVGQTTSAGNPVAQTALNGPLGAPMPLPEANSQSTNQYDFGQTASAGNPVAQTAFNGPPSASMPLPEANFQSMNQYDVGQTTSAGNPVAQTAFNGPLGAPMPLPEANSQSTNQYDFGQTTSAGNPVAQTAFNGPPSASMPPLEPNYRWSPILNHLDIGHIAGNPMLPTAFNGPSGGLMPQAADTMLQGGSGYNSHARPRAFSAPTAPEEHTQSSASASSNLQPAGHSTNQDSTPVYDTAYFDPAHSYAEQFDPSTHSG